MSDKKTYSNPKGAGRPRIIMDWDMLDKLLTIQCTLPELSVVLEMSEDSIQNIVKREKGKKFSEYALLFATKLKVSLRREIIDMAINQKDKGMLIYLSKQYLGFSDKVEFKQKPEKKPKRIRFYEDKDKSKT